MMERIDYHVNRFVVFANLQRVLSNVAIHENLDVTLQFGLAETHLIPMGNSCTEMQSTV